MQYNYINKNIFYGIILKKNGGLRLAISWGYSNLNIDVFIVLLFIVVGVIAYLVFLKIKEGNMKKKIIGFAKKVAEKIGGVVLNKLLT